MNFYQFIIPRLNGKDIEKDFDYYLGLVKKGIAGFIIFGGKIEAVRQGISELQKEAERPLIIAADLERGLGQQLVGDSTLREGGTIFPPAMAIAAAFRSCQPSAISYQQKILLRKIFKAVALEAGYAGINTILAPVLDINTNPKNPIISTRAFGEDAETVSFFGIEMIKILQANGISACGKHFPGHGDTEIDSHIGLPLIKKDMQSLEKTELVPFRGAVKAGVKMIMLGHLKVPALDPSGIPASLSEKAVRYLRDRMGFKGILITDALNMGGIGKYSEEKASLMALRAGVDLLLHPTDPERVVAYLGRKVLGVRCQVSGTQLWRKKKTALSIPDFEGNKQLSEKITKMSIRIDGQIGLLKKPFLIILNDEENAPSPIPLPRRSDPSRRPATGGEGLKGRVEDVSLSEKGRILAERLKEKFPDLKLQILHNGSDIRKLIIPEKTSVIVAVFSGIKAWKGGPSPWLLKCIKELEGKAGIFISFGSPYILDAIEKDCTKIYACWDSDSAQKAVAEVL